MSHNIEYHFAPNSPWTYLGHERLRRIARAAGASIEVLPIDLGQIFPVSGGLPLAKRAPQRQAYRLVDLKRFSQALGLPLTLHPKHFPVAADDAARLIITVQANDGTEAALNLAGAVMRAVWVHEQNIADGATLAALVREAGLDAQRLQQAKLPAAQERYAANTARALAAGVFGAPSYIALGELFWGQDRLDLLERRLAAA